MKFYLAKNCYSCQAEAWAFLNLRFGYTCFGLMKSKWLDRRPWWMPHLSLEVFAPVPRCGQVMLFLIQIQNSEFYFCTKGDAAPTDYAYKFYGFNLRLRR